MEYRALVSTFLRRLQRLDAAGPLFVRLTLGALFVQSGSGKLAHLARTADFFRSLGIPAPELQATFIGNLEFFGGLCLVVGLAVRLLSVPLAATMVVAIFTAKLGDVEGILDLLALDEARILAALVWLVLAGPGALAVDRLVRSRFLPHEKNPQPHSS